jgi:hypothetical protein
MSSNEGGSHPLAGIPATRLAEWEDYGVDIIEADLKRRDGLTYVGSGEAVRQAWQWVRHKRAEERRSQAALANIISIGSMTGSVIQQGSPGANQAADFVLNVDEAKTALAEFEAALEALALPSDALDDLQGDIATIKSQLAKRQPLRSILTEAGRSIRNITEGLAAGMMIGAF